MRAHPLPLAALCLGLAFAATAADPCQRVKDEIAGLDRSLAKKRADFEESGPAEPEKVVWVKKYLAMLVAVDQELRFAAMEWPAKHEYDEKETACFWKLLEPRWKKIDDGSTEALRDLMKRHGWITISKFGEEAADQAWLLAQHADRDRDFQRQVLKVLEKLWPKDEVRPRHYAYLEDRVRAYADKKPQRYGTQGACKGKHKWEPEPIEAPEKLEERRKAMGLPPYEEQKKRLDELCL